MNIDQFRLRFPEFSETPDAIVSANLADTLLEFSVDVWGDLLDRGHGNLTAHLLSSTPYGQQAKLVAKDGQTTYMKEYERLRAIVGCGGVHVAEGLEVYTSYPWQ